MNKAWVPGNFLTEGTVFITPAMTTMNPNIQQFYERDIIAFQVIDSLDGNSARGEWGGRMGGVVRPLLKWETQFNSNSFEAVAAVGERAK